MARARSTTAVIVGAGLMGRWHARAAAQAGARIAAVVDPDLSRASTVARAYRGCVAITSLDELHTIDGACLVHVCTPTATHAPLVRDILRRPWPALVEKPVAEDATTTRALVEAARRAGTWICPVHQFVFQRGVREVLDRLGTLGELVHVRATVCSAGAVGAQAEPDAVARDILPHLLSLIERLSPGRLGAAEWTGVRSQPGELSIAGRAGRVALTLIISMHARPTLNELVVAGSRATAVVDLFHGFVTWDTGRVSRTSKMQRPFSRASRTALSAGTNLLRRAAARQAAYPGLWELVTAAHDAVRQGQAPPITADETLTVAAARDRILAVVSERR